MLRQKRPLQRALQRLFPVQHPRQLADSGLDTVGEVVAVVLFRQTSLQGRPCCQDYQFHFRAQCTKDEVFCTKTTWGFLYGHLFSSQTLRGTSALVAISIISAIGNRNIFANP